MIECSVDHGDKSFNSKYLIIWLQFYEKNKPKFREM